MYEDTILMEFGVSKKDLVDNFQMGTETALVRANMIRTTKIETLQAFVMYMVGSVSTVCHAFFDVLIVEVVKSTNLTRPLKSLRHIFVYSSMAVFFVLS